jgi:hypothetical protein
MPIKQPTALARRPPGHMLLLIVTEVSMCGYGADGCLEPQRASLERVELHAGAPLQHMLGATPSTTLTKQHTGERRSEEACWEWNRVLRCREHATTTKTKWGKPGFQLRKAGLTKNKPGDSHSCDKDSTGEWLGQTPRLV